MFTCACAASRSQLRMTVGNVYPVPGLILGRGARGRLGLNEPWPGIWLGVPEGMPSNIIGCYSIHHPEAASHTITTMYIYIYIDKNTNIYINMNI